MKRYKSYGADRTSFQRLADWLENREVIKGHSFKAEPGSPQSLGALPDDWQRTVTARRGLIDYTVYSYGTPIAWHDREAGWIQPDEKYSPTTTRQQNNLSAALSIML